MNVQPIATGSSMAGAVRATAPTSPMSLDRGTATIPAGTSFGTWLAEALGQVNALQQASDRMTDDFVAGRTDSIHEVMIAGEKASLSLQLAMEIRNKVLEAYQEINRMQI